MGVSGSSVPTGFDLSGVPLVNGKKVDPKIAGGSSGGWANGLFDTVKDAVKDAGAGAAEVAKDAADKAADATKAALIRKYTLFGTLWETGEGGGVKVLPMGYVVAAGAIGYLMFGRK